MSSPSLALPDLAQQVAQKQSELEQLQRAFEARMTELQRRKEELEAHLRQVEAEIQAVNRGSGSLAATAPPAAPSPAASPPSPVSPAGAAAGATITWPPLPEMLVRIIRENQRAMTPRELTDELTRRSYPSRSGNLAHLVGNRIRELIARKVLARTRNGKGVMLHPSRAQASSAPPAVARNTSPATASKLTPAPTPAQPATPPPAATSSAANGSGNGSTPPAQPTLSDVLTTVLGRHNKPIRVPDLTAEVLASGYATTSQRFLNVVWSALAKMKNVENVPGQGYRLKRSATRSK